MVSTRDSRKVGVGRQKPVKKAGSRLGKLWLPVLGLGLVITIVVAVEAAVLLTKEKSWGGNEPFRWILVPREPEACCLWLVGYYPQVKKVLVLKIPRTVTVDAAGNYGRYRIGSLMKLGEQEKQEKTILPRTLMRTLGLSIRNFGQTKPLTEQDDQSAVARDTKTRTGQLVFIRIAQRDFSAVDLARVWWRLKGLPVSSFDLIDLRKKNIYESVTDVDGNQITLFNELQLDALLDNVQRPYFTQETPLTVAIENTTNKTGYAMLTRRIVDHDGYDVVAVTDSFKTILPNTLIVVGDKKVLQPGMKGEFSWLFPEAEFRLEDTGSYRSDIVIRLGQRGGGGWE
jgi:hypothetical protein